MINNVLSGKYLKGRSTTFFLVFAAFYLCILLILLFVEWKFGNRSLLIGMISTGSISLWLLAPIIVLRQNELAAIFCIAVSLYVDWYLGMRFVALGVICVLLAILYRNRSSQQAWILPRTPWLWILLLLLTLLQVPRAYTLGDGITYYLTDFATPLFAFWLGNLLAQDSKHVQRFFAILAGFITVLALITLIKATTGRLVFAAPHFDQYIAQVADFPLFKGSPIHRVGSFFVNPDWNGTFFTTIVFIPLSLFFASSTLRAKCLYLCEVLLCVLALLSTYSTGAWLAGIVALPLFLTFLGNKRARLFLLGVVVLLSAILLIFFRAQLSHQMLHITTATSLSTRLIAWQTAIRVIETFPFTGLGLGLHAYLYRAAAFRVSFHYRPLAQPHNSYLEIGAMGGLPVLFLFLALFFLGLWWTFRNWKRAGTQSRVLLAGGIAAILALSINSLSINGWTLAPLAVLGWLILGVISSPLLLQSASPAVISTQGAQQEQKPEEQKIVETYNEQEQPLESHYPKALKKITLLKLGRQNDHALSTESPFRYDYQDSDFEFIDIPDLPTVLMPAVAVGGLTSISQKLESVKKSEEAESAGTGSQLALLRKLVESSGLYALSSVAIPLIGLVLSPFLTHHLSLADYGALAITNTAIGLSVGVTQLGLSSAFFRAYGYDYTTEQDRNDVVTTVTALLSIISFSFALLVAFLAPQLSSALFGHTTFALALALAGGVVLLQNLTLPGMFMRRVDNRPLSYSLLSLSNLLVTLLATLVLVGILHEGIVGAILANGLGYACIVICTLPGILWRKGIRLRLDIAKSMLAFGLPLIINFISYWVLQLLDRYLLSRFTSLDETAKYTVAYTLGSVISVAVITPFTLAWSTIMFSVAKRKDAPQTFKVIFRWFSMVLLFAAFALSFAATVILDWLFPASYHTAANIIPLVANALVFYGAYFVFMAGANLQRKMWLAAVFMTIAAVVNIGLNLILIPSYGALGAAAATLIAYIVLALTSYPVNQRLYPIPFEIGRFICAQLLGMGLYFGCNALSQHQGTFANWGIHVGGLLLYALCLTFLGNLLPWKHLLEQQKNVNMA